MIRILVVEDSPTQAVEIEFVLQEAGYTVTRAPDGAAALAAIEADPPDLVLTDLHMPRKNGLELTEAVRRGYPQVPVVLMTADGTEDIAARALRQGASSYIPKNRLQQDLLYTIGELAKSLLSRKAEGRVIDALTESQSTFRFGNDHEFVDQLVAHLERDLRNMDYGDETGVFRIVLALKEALLNAIDHGNLELDSSMRDESSDGYHELGDERKLLEPYRDRRVNVVSRISPTQVTFVIRDEGPGFDPSTVPDPTDPENLLRAHGRGLMLIQSFMDDVSFNETGNEITLVKYRQPPEEE